MATELLSLLVAHAFFWNTTPMIAVEPMDKDGIVVVTLSGKVRAEEYRSARVQMQMAIEQGASLWWFHAVKMRVPEIRAFVLDMAFTTKNRHAFKRNVFMTDSKWFAGFSKMLSKVMPVQHFFPNEREQARQWLLQQ